ncbi:MAG: Gfo/Idh/MocA family oxidoreductase [Clostridiales bacterium]|nr:Gfo/Idh/MocA family oxidoreductase [Clostridiales bacterium]
MAKLKTAVLGCGKVGAIHAACFQRLPGSQFVGAVGTRPGRGAAFGKRFGVPGFDSLEELVHHTGAQVVSICSPHPAHARHAVEAARLGLHIAVEKPLAASLKDCDAIIQAARAAGVTGTTISQRRFYRPAQRIKEAILQGKLGQPVLGTVNMLGWRDMDYYRMDPWRGTWAGEGGGVLVNQAPHQLDLLLWYLGEVKELYGFWDRLNHPQLEVEDTAIAILRFRSGALGNIVVSNAQHPALFGKVRVHGYNGASVGVQTDGGAMFIAGVSGIAQAPVNDLWTIQGEEDRLADYQAQDRAHFEEVDSVHHYHQLQLQDFLDAIREGRAPQITLEDGRRTVELFTAIYRSQRDRGLMTFPLQVEAEGFDGRG